ncbi:MAG TPA: GAF domain-containing protein [Candidatus Dormibacteraeota bacterium]|nr:GAF domain-containing protein [Candidatus Dormibacteraeota bacterium]
MAKLDLHHPRPLDATLSVTRAAEVLGVHANTVRAWSDAGRLRYYRINPRGDRRYRHGDLQRFLAGLDAAGQPPASGEVRIASRRRGEPSGFAAVEPVGAVVSMEEHEATLGLIGALSALSGSAIKDALDNPGAPLDAAVRTIHDALDVRHASAWRLEDGRLTPQAWAGAVGRGLVPLPGSFGVLGGALAQPDTVVEDPGPAGLSAANQGGREVACTIPGEQGAWGVLLLVRDLQSPMSDSERELLRVAATAIGNIIRAATSAADVAHQLQRADALRRVTSDIGSRLDLDEILERVIDHATVLFSADRVAAFLFEEEGHKRMAASRGLSTAWINTVTQLDTPTLGSAAIAARRPLFSVRYAQDPRVGDLRAAVIQEGFDTCCLAPLLDGDSPEPLGLLGVYHDQAHPWSPDELETMAALATQATVAIKAAGNYAQLATWAAQLQSIHALGARLNRLTRVKEIGDAIATELRQLIDYHNVRVYRLYGDDLVPVAMQGRVGEYLEETPELLKIQFGAGITGWVAEHRLAQRLDDAAADPRAQTIAGTADDLDESMLLAPMLFEDEVLGVLVLSKLGLRQFRADDLRLLEIYASLAAQAMANADATEQLREKSAALEQKVRGQRELLQITESILTTLDPPVLLGTIADRLGDLIGSDNVSIELIDHERGGLSPVVARGADADYYLQGWEVGESGLATWVLEHNESVRIIDEFDDTRVLQPPSGPVHGSLVCVPLRGRAGAIGVLTLERLGEGRVFSDDEFELVQLFAAQASIALQNAEVHMAVRQRAQTDVLTGLLNHGTFAQQLDALITADEPFSLVMLDLDSFKPVNDGMGHQAGDLLLRQVADAIVAASRDSDRVFRYGGDEFAVLLPRTDGEQVGTIAERVRAAVKSVVGPGSTWRGKIRSLEASAGTASFPHDGARAEEILLAADRALFVAKRSGGGRVASAAEGLALVGEFTLQTPTPIDPLVSPAA